MKRLPYPLYRIFLVLLVTGCNNPAPRESVKLLQAERFDLGCPGSDQNFTHLGYYASTRNEYITYTTSSQEILGLDIKSKKTGFRIPVKLFDNLEDFNGSGYYIHNLDSIFILPFDSVAIYLVNGSGAVTNKWVIRDTLENNVSRFSFVHLPQMPFAFRNNKVHVMNARMDIVVNTPEARKLYFASTPGLAIDISAGTPVVSSQTGYWPDQYKTGKDYSDYHPQRCIGPGNELVYGFSVNDSIWVYRNNAPPQRIECRSRYATAFTEYNRDSTFNFSYKERYWVTEPRYTSITYDPFHGYYYRIFKQAIDFEKPGGLTTHQSSDKPWSIIILNREFEIVNEITFDPTLFLSYLFPCKEGILVANRLKAGRTDGIDYSFTLFKIQD